MARGCESKAIEDQQQEAAALQRACRPAHRGMLEQALADIDAKVTAVRMG